MRREERVTVQGPVKEQQPDGMSHRAGGGGGWTHPPPPHLPFRVRQLPSVNNQSLLTGCRWRCISRRWSTVALSVVPCVASSGGAQWNLF